jgi:hypothetical protein
MVFGGGRAETRQHEWVRSPAMNAKKTAANTLLPRSTAAVSLKAAARPGHNAPPTIEQFDRERMGIAAKE